MRIILTGDALFSSRNLANRLDATLVEQLHRADAVFTNAEFTTPNPETTVAAGRGYVTAVRPETLAELQALNIKLVSFANNHSGDFGIAGMQDTLTAAKAHHLIAGGLAGSLDEARLPKFYDAADGRIGFVTATATRADVFIASNGGNGVPPRPGVNPLRWSETYQVTAEQFDQLQRIADSLGLTESAAKGRRIERWPEPPANILEFGSLFQSHLKFEQATTAAFKTQVEPIDLAALKASIADAKRRSDFVFFNLHTHEGARADWYADQPADFVVEAAHAAIDAGADLVIGHGAHFMRGAERYHGKPIFYNLGSLLMEFEAGESIIPPEMYTAYQLDTHAKPSDLHHHRAVDETGQFVGFNAHPKFSQNIALDVTINNNQVHIKVIPLDLGLNRDNPVQRGLPKIAAPAVAKQIFERLNQLSAYYDTQFSYVTQDDTFEFVIE